MPNRVVFRRPSDYSRRAQAGPDTASVSSRDTGRQARRGVENCEILLWQDFTWNPNLAVTDYLRIFEKEDVLITRPANGALTRKRDQEARVAGLPCPPHLTVPFLRNP